MPNIGFVANRIDRVRPDAPVLAGYGALHIGVRRLALTNPDQIDMLRVTQSQVPRQDRHLTVELWYPTGAANQGGVYDTVLRDGQTQVQLVGRALRDAPLAGGRWPLVVISHGYPGNRFLMAHLAETLASRGYVVAAIDHTDSTYGDLAVFGSTLFNRPLDLRFVMDWLASEPTLAADIDIENVGIIGYSMGGYGALIAGGAGISAAATGAQGEVPQRLLARYQAASADFAAQADHRIKAILPIGPWGRQRGIWDAVGLGAMRTPMLIMAGSADEISSYSQGMRLIFDEATASPRHLLTFVNAGHNAAAPIPAPEESWVPSAALDFVPFEHYADRVWDSTRMNNIAQHFAAAFFGQHLKSDAEMAPYLDCGVTGQDWPGFAPGTARGLQLENRRP